MGNDLSGLIARVASVTGKKETWLKGQHGEAIDRLNASGDCSNSCAAGLDKYRVCDGDAYARCIAEKLGLKKVAAGEAEEKPAKPEKKKDASASEKVGLDPEKGVGPYQKKVKEHISGTEHKKAAAVLRAFIKDYDTIFEVTPPKVREDFLKYLKGKSAITQKDCRKAIDDAIEKIEEGPGKKISSKKKYKPSVGLRVGYAYPRYNLVEDGMSVGEGMNEFTPFSLHSVPILVNFTFYKSKHFEAFVEAGFNLYYGRVDIGDGYGRVNEDAVMVGLPIQAGVVVKKDWEDFGIGAKMGLGTEVTLYADNLTTGSGNMFSSDGAGYDPDAFTKIFFKMFFGPQFRFGKEKGFVVEPMLTLSFWNDDQESSSGLKKTIKSNDMLGFMLLAGVDF